MVQEGVTWFSGKGVPTLNQNVTVDPKVVPFYGGSIDPAGTPGTMSLKSTITVPIRVQNLSNFNFGSDVNVGYHWYDANGSTVVWDGMRTSIAGLAKNEVRAVNVTVATPAIAGRYTLKFDMVREGFTWFSSQGMMLAPNVVNVMVPALSATYAAPVTTSGAAGATIVVPVAVTNTGTTVWTPGAFSLSYHLYAASGNVYVWDGARTALTQPVPNNGLATLNALVRMPPIAGTFTIRFDLVQEGVSWFSGYGVPTGNVSLTVQ
jgi:hypothetical protein